MFRLCSLLLVAACGAPTTTGTTTPTGTSDGTPGFASDVAIEDPDGVLAGSHADLITCANAGLAEWARYLGGPTSGTVTVELLVKETATGRLGAASTSNVPSGACKSDANCKVVEEQAIHRLRTGEAHPSNQRDIRVTVAPAYWRDKVWVDPDPQTRETAVPADRFDCVSLFTHELGHAFGFTGFRDLASFERADVHSLFDELVVVGDGTLEFVGPKAGTVALTRTNTTQNIYHYGDPSAPSELDDGLMNGIVWKFGKRYYASALDIAMLEDLGVPVHARPE